MPTATDVQLDGLPDVVAITIPEQKYFDGLPFPLILTPSITGRSRSEWQQWVRDNLNTLKSLHVTYGAILFRGFSMDTPEDFDLFAKTFGWTEFPYVGGVSVRVQVTGNVYTSAEAPPEFNIPFHHEMGHVAVYPKVLFAYCDVPPLEGGETSLVLSNVIYRMMAEREPEFVARLTKEGVCYTRVAPEETEVSSGLGRSWKSTFYADDKETAQLNAQNAGFSVEWLPDGSMKYTTAPLEAIRVDPRTGKTIWFNSCHSCYIAWSDVRNDRFKAALFENGDQMPAGPMETLDQVFQEASVSCRWQKGDVVMVDNVLAQHARNHYTPPRRILVSLFKD